MKTATYLVCGVCQKPVDAPGHAIIIKGPLIGLEGSNFSQVVITHLIGEKDINDPYEQHAVHKVCLAEKMGLKLEPAEKERWR